MGHCRCVEIVDLQTHFFVRGRPRRQRGAYRWYLKKLRLGSISTLFRTSTAYGLLTGSSTAGMLVMATKSSIVDNARRGIARRRSALGVYKRHNARPHARHLGLCGRRGGEIMRPRAQTGESLISVPVTSQWCAQDGAGQPARTAWPPRLVTLVEGHHVMRMLYMLRAAVRASRV